jgi:2-polyprenyl-3-methyl-5-hydroxy-6-metoxy-1,4-benzoquinol methylase
MKLNAKIMIKSDKNKWDLRYLHADHVQYPVAEVLTENAYLLPQSGNALDLACGIGANAIFLASHGLTTAAWDSSDIAIKKLKEFASGKKLPLAPEVLQIEQASLKPTSYDVIVVSKFLDRGLCANISNSLKPGGLVFYQTFTQEKTTLQGPSNPDFLLAKNELLNLFNSLSVVYYRENGKLGSISQGIRNQALFIGQRPRS